MGVKRRLLMVALDTSLNRADHREKALKSGCRAAMGKRYFDRSAQFITDSF